MPAGACLGDETIAALLEGRLADAAARGARGHIATCDACRRMVSAALGGPPKPRDAATHVGHATLDAIAPGAVIAGKYRVERAIGEGGMGRVFAARQVGLERPVALKVLRPELAGDPTALHRFQREARLVASLDSDHVVRVHDLGELPTGEPYLVMELLDGEDLGTIVARGAVPLALATGWILAACDALGEAHALGMVHRDIKPSNLFLTRGQRIKVLDFGLAKLARPLSAAGETMTGAGVMLGSPRYMAPEQIVGARAVDARADVWSLGATLYHLVTGRPPFADQALEAVFASILAGQLPSLDGVPPALADVLRRALARDPAARFASAAELAVALRAALPAEGSRVPRLVLALGAIAAAGGIASVAFLAGRSQAADSSAAAADSPSRGDSRSGSDSPSTRDSRSGSHSPSTSDSPSSSQSTSSTDSPSITDSPTRGDSPSRGDSPRAGSSSGGDPWSPPTATAAKHVPASGGNGPLGNMDETRLRARLGTLGWTIKEVDRQQFPGCMYTRLQAGKGKASADVTLFECQSREDAAWQGQRLRHGIPNDWTVDDGTVALSIAASPEIGVSEEKFAKQLFDALVTP